MDKVKNVRKEWDSKTGKWVTPIAVSVNEEPDEDTAGALMRLATPIDHVMPGNQTYQEQNQSFPQSMEDFQDMYNEFEREMTSHYRQQFQLFLRALELR